MPNPPDFSRITPNQIAEALELPVGKLFQISADPSRFYHPERMAKTKGGKERLLDVPKWHFKLRVLKELHKFLQKYRLFSESAHGGVKRRSTFSSAERHLGRSVVCIRDISDCYPSISTEQLRLKLLSLGFRSDTAKLLSGLLTCRNRIPQGASTSGDALNLFLFDIDCAVAEICGDDVSFTRMADDHVLSGNDKRRVEEVADFLEKELLKNGLKVNQEKKASNGTTVQPNRQCVHSIGVNHPSKTRIPRDRAKEYLEYAEKYVRAARSVSAQSLPAVATIRRTLNGYINYSMQAGLSPAAHLSKLMAQGDRLVGKRLKKEKVTRSSKWWFSNGKRDRSIECAEIWKKMKGEPQASSTRKFARGSGKRTGPEFQVRQRNN